MKHDKPITRQMREAAGASAAREFRFFKWAVLAVVAWLGLSWLGGML